MARLRQQYPQAYFNSGAISTDFENIVRYLNAAELGNLTISELMQKLFDDSGNVDVSVEFRLDTTNGLQYRIGTYASAEEGWVTVATIDSLRGNDGSNIGYIEAPFFYNRQDFIATAGQTIFTYDINDQLLDVVVWVNGILQPQTGAYTTNDGNNTLTFAVGLNLSDKVTIVSIRNQEATSYARSDLIANGSQTVFPFSHDPTDEITVFRNGILQRSGGSYDYTSDSTSDTITFMVTPSNNDRITIMRVVNRALTNVVGLMTESVYTNGAGYINYSKLNITDGQIPQAKISGLSAALPLKGELRVSATAPVSPSTGWLWIDTAVTPNLLKFYDGTQWITTSPTNTLPSFTSSNALAYVRVNAVGSALEYATVDFSSLVPKSYMAVANGVATLDSGAKVPLAQIPAVWNPIPLYYNGTGAVTNGTKLLGRVFGHRMKIYGFNAKLSAISTNSVSLQIAIDGVTYGTALTLSSSVAQTHTLSSPIEVVGYISGSSVVKRLEIVVSGTHTGATDLEIGFDAEVTYDAV